MFWFRWIVRIVRFFDLCEAIIVGTSHDEGGPPINHRIPYLANLSWFESVGRTIWPFTLLF
jgi:hypothetical protein